MLIDWISFNVPYSLEPIATQEFEVPFGSGQIMATKLRPVRVKTSAKSSITIFGSSSRLYFDGNPVKFLTGQNVVGSKDPLHLIRLLVDALDPLLGLKSCPRLMGALDSGDIDLTRVDCTAHFRVGTDDDDVNTWLRGCADSSTIERRGRGLMAPAFLSVGWGFQKQEHVEGKKGGSRRGNFKFYNKHLEMKKRPPDLPQETVNKLTHFVLGCVRAEACYRGMALKDLGLRNLRDWGPETPDFLLEEWTRKVEMNGNVDLLTVKEEDLPRKLRSTYALWASGRDVLALMSKTNFYRHKRELKEYGIDISLPVQTQKKRTVVLVDILTAKPVEEPPIFDDLCRDLVVSLAA